MELKHCSRITTASSDGQVLIVPFMELKQYNEELEKNENMS